MKELMKTPPSSPATKLSRQILSKRILLGTRRKTETERALLDLVDILKDEVRLEITLRQCF